MLKSLTEGLNLLNKAESKLDNNIIEKKNWRSKINAFIVGDNEKVNLEKKIYIYSSFIAFTACSLGFVWNYIIDLSFILNVFIGLILISYVILYLLARCKGKYYTTIIVLVSQVGLALTWISSGGSSGSVLPFFLVAILPFIAFSKSKNHLLYLLLTLMNIAFLYFIENSKFNSIIIKYPDQLTHDIDVAFSLIFSLVISYAFIHLIVVQYNKENTKVRNQNKELEKLYYTKDKFFSIIAHDLRGPFIGISELTKLMADESMNLSKDELIDLSRRVSQSSKMTFSLLENLLNWAKMSQGLTKYQPKTIGLNSFVLEHLGVLEENIKNKEIKTSVSIPDDMDVFADEIMLQTIIRNLILNAVKFTQKGGSVSIKAGIFDNDMIEISVNDNGIGMTKEIVDNIFSQGEQIRRAGTENEPSSGLGLLLCKEFVSMHGGKIYIESEEGKGSNFKFTISASL